MKNYLSKTIMLSFLLMISMGAMAAPVMMDWQVVAGPVTSGPTSVGGIVTTTSATLFDENNAVLATGEIGDFQLSNGAPITGVFTSGAGSYSILGFIDTIEIFNSGVFNFTGIEANGDIALGSISVDPGSSSLNLSGASLDFTPVPIPAAIWLFGSAVIGLFGYKRKGLL